MTTKLVVTGISCCVQIYLSARKQSWLFGRSNERDFTMEHLISTKPDYVLTEVNKLGNKTTRILMLLLLHRLVLNRGDIKDLTDSNWSRGLVLLVLATEQNLKGIICFKLTNECCKTFSENYGKS